MSLHLHTHTNDTLLGLATIGGVLVCGPGPSQSTSSSSMPSYKLVLEDLDLEQNVLDGVNVFFQVVCV